VLPEGGLGPSRVAVVGYQAPDFAAPDFSQPDSAYLRRWLGRPILMVFYSPKSKVTEEVLRFAQNVGDTFPQGTVLGLSISPGAEAVRQQRSDMRLSFPVLDGSGLRVAYEVEATPKMVILDAAGLVRGHYLGWGRETPGEVLEELRRWLPAGPTPRK